MKLITLILLISFTSFGSAFAQLEGDAAYFEIAKLLYDDPIGNKQIIYSKSYLLDYEQKKFLYNDYSKNGGSIALINIIPYLSIGSWANGWWGAGLAGTGGQVLGTWLMSTQEGTLYSIGLTAFTLSWFFGVIYPFVGVSDFNEDLKFMLRMDEFVPVSFYPTYNLNKDNKMYPGLGISVGF